jgi:hypothetical protein
MPIFALVAGLALLYFWLIGHWFARVLVFLVFILAGIAAPRIFDNANPFALLIGFPLAGWVIAAIPTYVHRWRVRAQPA